MKMLLLGGNGQIGWELQRALAPLGQVIALGRVEDNGLCGDLTRPEALTATVRRVAPDVIVNAAAYTAVNQAESEPGIAHAVNADAPAVLASEAKDLGAWLVHYSTDYVFDGGGDRPWREEDPTGPVNVYGDTKRAGEVAVQESGCRHLIFRTGWVYAARGRNFMHTMLRLAAERDTLQVIDDQYGAPTGAELIADVTGQVLPAVMRNVEHGGIYHLAARGETTWYDYARTIVEQGRSSGWPVRVRDDAIVAVSSDAFAVKARRPHNSRLDCGKLESAFGLEMPDWRPGVHRTLAEILACEGQRGSR